MDRAREVTEDLRLFGRVAGRSRQGERLVRKRHSLVAESERIQALLDGTAAPATTQSSPFG